MIVKLLCLALTAIAAVSLSASAQTYEGDECTQDCSGHRAGYEWAAEKGITDASQCGGNSGSFIEGCEAFAENPDREDTTVDDDGNPIEE